MRRGKLSETPGHKADAANVLSCFVMSKRSICYGSPCCTGCRYYIPPVYFFCPAMARSKTVHSVALAIKVCSERCRQNATLCAVGILPATIRDISELKTMFLRLAILHEMHAHDFCEHNTRRAQCQSSIVHYIFPWPRVQAGSATAHAAPCPMRGCSLSSPRARISRGEECI